MFCKNCGAQISETTRFCPKCGTAATPPPSVTSPNSSFSSQQSSSFSTTAQSTAAKIKKNPIQLVLIVAGILVLLIIVIAFCNRSKNGMKSSSKAAGAYLVAVYDEDVNDILDLVPDEIIKQIMKNYGCSKKQLKEAVKAELRNESEDYPHCDSVTSYGSTKQTRQYSEYIDRRVEDCMDEDKISKMELCVVNVEDDYYYYDQPAYQYGRDKHTWYSMDATNFVAYAVWEKY
jgi:uncharacterized membrane protein YvbJ